MSMRTLTPPHGLTDAANASELQITEGRIEFRNVDFAYGRDIGGVENIDLTIAPGEKLAIVGASGAGNSTLVALLTAVVLFAEPFVLQQGVGFGLIWIALAIYAFDGLSRHRRVAPVAVQCAEAVAPVKDAPARVE